MYAPHSEQPKLNRSREELSENERIVYDAFMNEEYVNKLVNFLSLEEVKGKDNFSHKKMILFKVEYYYCCNLQLQLYLLIVRYNSVVGWFCSELGGGGESVNLMMHIIDMKKIYYF